MRRLAPLLLLLATAANGADGARVTIRVDGLDASRGQVLVVMFDRADGYPSKPEKARLKAAVPAKAPETTVTFDGVTPGTWAAFAVHDEDGDGEVALGWLIPIPKEPVGATRDAKGRMGPPKFEDAAFTVPAAGTTQRIHVQRL